MYNHFGNHFYQRSILLVFASFVFFGCGTSDWKQFHGGEQNVGYTGVHTSHQLSAKWKAPFHIGYITYSSPAIGSDGTIYLGTTTGAVVAINNDGSGFKWVFRATDDMGMINPTIVSSPSVGVNGDIYVTVTHDIGQPCPLCSVNYATALVKLSSGGVLENSFEFNHTGGFGTLYTTASPKLLNWNGTDFVFIVSEGSILVFDNNLQKISEHTLNCSGDLKSGEYPGSNDYDGLTSGNGAPGGAHFFDTYQEPNKYWIDPTVAVIKRINGKDLGAPLAAVVMDGCGLETFEWSPPPITGLTSKWFAPRTFEELLSSPAISDGGEVVLGSSSGWLFSYDMVTGKANWIYNTHEPVVATPVFFAGVGDLYALGTNNMFRLENGGLQGKFALPGPTESSCAMSMDGMIISSQVGVNLLGFDFSGLGFDNSIHGGMSSPAIGSDGTMYVVSNTGMLMAYQVP